MTRSRVCHLDSNMLIGLATPEFWPDDASYLDLPTRGINGHRQVTDAYLALLAAKHGGVLATMDRALAATQQGVLLLDEAS